MSNLHGPVINDIGKVVGWKTITLPDDEVLFGLPLAVTGIEDILDNDGLVAALESHGILFPFGSSVV